MPMKNFIQIIKNKISNFIKFISINFEKAEIELLIKVLSFLMLFSWIYYLSDIKYKEQYFNLKIGDISPYDIKAENDIEYIDQSATKQKIEMAVRSLPLIFKKNNDILNENIEKINKFFNDIEKLSPNEIVNYFWNNYNKKINLTNAKILLENFNETKTISLKILNYLFQAGIANISKEDLNKISDASYIVVSTSSENQESINNVPVENIYFISNLSISEVIIKNYPRISKEKANIISKILSIFIEPNLIYDNILTEENIKNRIKVIEPVKKIIKKGKIILRYGEEITESTFNILTQIKESSSKSKVFRNYILLLLIIFIITFILFYNYGGIWFKTNKNFFFLVVFSFVMATINYYSVQLSKFLPVRIENSFFVPITTSAILLSHLVSYSLSYMVILFISITTTFLLGLQFLDFVILFLIGFFVLLVSKNLKKRIFLWYLGLIVAFFYLIIILIVSKINNYTKEQFLNAFLIGVANGIISTIIATGFLPLFEILFNLLTEYRLLELSDLNLPIMKKLLIEAPGTYHHSIIVGNLAEAAAKEINANPLLARVGGYYHDIGKIENAEYFIENIENPEISKHSKLKPSISSSIVKSHVKYGINLGKKLRLPKEVIDIIAQHHGTTIISIFYKKAILETPPDERDNILANYMYDGPKVQTKEAALVMLADSVEAATRALKKPSHPRIVSTVKDIINTRFLEGELDESPLTLKDLNKIAETFIQVLSAIYHTRIEYPEKEEIERLKNGN